MQYQALCRDDTETRLANLPVGVKELINLEFWVQNLKGRVSILARSVHLAY